MKKQVTDNGNHKGGNLMIKNRINKLVKTTVVTAGVLAGLILPMWNGQTVRADVIMTAMPAAVAGLSALPTKVNSIESFINDSRWKNGVSWTKNQTPKLSTWKSWGCAAYCADYVRFCYNQTGWSSGTKFTNINEIRKGDVITIGNPNDGSGHWFIVLSRSGNKITTAEGSFSSKVRVGGTYTISGNKFAENSNTFTNGWHFLPETNPDPAPSHATSANIKDGTYMLRNAGSKYAMNWDYGSSARTVWMSKYGDENSNEQHFKFTHTGSGKYKIESCHSLGNVINCECGLPVTAGVKVTVRKYTDNDTQKFYVTPVGNGNYILQSASNPNLVIGAPSTAFHAALEIQNYSKGNNNQLWQFDQDPTLNPSYTITASSASNGTVKLSKTSAKEGEEITVTTTPASGYQLDTIKVNGSAISGSKFKMPAKNTTVAVTFKKVVYTVKVGTVSNGTAKLSKSSASIGDEITVTATPSKNYELNWIKVNGSVISGNKFKMPAANATVDVNFKRKDAPAYGGTATVNGLKYKVTNAASDGTGTVALTGTANSAELVVIPETVEINGYRYTVNKIAEKAFFNNTKVKKVYIGEKITVIEANAFYGCTNLVQVTGGANLKTIGQNAFARCSKLSEFVIASKVLYKIAPQAFYMDTSLKTISIKNTTKLTKSGVKKSLKGSSVKTVKVKKSKVKKYKKIFKKANSGKAVTVKK